MALKEFSEAEKELADLGEKLPLEAVKHELDIAQAKAQLEDMEQREQAFKDLESGRKRLKIVLAAKDSEGTRKAMEAVGMAEMILRDLHQNFPKDEGLMANAVVQLDVMVAEEQAAARRLAATERLAEAVASRSPQLCAGALAEAQAAGLEPTPTAQLAEILANPSGLCEALASEAAELGGAGAVELRRSFGVTVDDFAEAAKATASGMDEAQLRGQAAFLVAAILRNHTLHSEYLEQHLSSAQVTLQERCLNRVEETMAKFNRERDAVEAARRMELEEAFRKKTEARVEEVTAKAAKEGEATRGALHQEAMKVIGDRVLIERGAIEQRLQSLSLPVEALGDLLRTGQSLQQWSLASTGLAAALLPLQSAFKEGRPLQAGLRALRAAAGEDDHGFARRLAERLPEATVARSATAVPTEPQLRLSFNKQLHGFKAAALAPPSAGPLTEIASRLAGGALAKLYALRAPECGALEEGSASEAARRNLAALSRAAPLVEAGDLRGALAALEGLTGACRASALDWMEETRHTLLLQQAMGAMQAKAQCLNAALS